MGTFAGHVVPGLAFAVLGLWHTFNTIASYKIRSAAFRSRTWFPLPCGTRCAALRNLELILILMFSVAAAVSQLLDIDPPHRLSLSFRPLDFEHSAMFLHVAVYASAALAAEAAAAVDLEGLVGMLGASALTQELFLLHFHSADHAGLEGHYHWLLQLLALVSTLSAVATTASPSSFPASLVRSVSILFQGLWFVNMGFALWGPGVLVPPSCSTPSTDGPTAAVLSVGCDPDVILSKAKALANLQFSWMLAMIWIVVVFICLKPTTRACVEYRRLHVVGSGGRSGGGVELAAVEEVDAKQEGMA